MAGNTMFSGGGKPPVRFVASTSAQGRVPTKVEIPERVMQVAPYMRSSYYRLDTPPTKADPFFEDTFRTQDPWFASNIGNTPAFFNDTGKVVRIKRIVFTGYFPNLPEGRTEVIDAYASTLYQVKVNTSKYEVTKDFVPVSIMQTDERQMHFDVMNNYYIELPSPYFMPRGEPFLLEVAPNQTSTDGWLSERNAHFGLHCTDVETGRDIFIPRVLHLTPYVLQTMQYPPTIQNVMFSDARDGALRDLWVHGISCSSGVPMIHTDWQHPGNHWQTNQDTCIMIRPRPNQGPRWHSEDWFEVQSLARDIPTMHGSSRYAFGPPCNLLGMNSCIVRHEPVVPYVLDPGDRIEIKFRVGYYTDNLGNLATVQDSIRLGVTLVGTQEG